MIVKDKKFYGSVLAIMIPITLQSLLGYGVQFIDSLMLSTLGEVPMAISSLANQPFTIYSNVLAGLVGGSSVMISQYWGKGDINTIQKVMSIAMKLVIAAALVMVFLALAFPAQIMGLYSKETDVIAAGVDYLRIVSVSYIFYGISFTYLMSVRAVEQARIVLAVNTVSYAVNIFLDYVFIFGAFGFPKLGIYGVALGTVIARLSEFIICICHMHFVEKRIKFKLRYLLYFNKTLFGDFIKVASPIILHEFIWGMGTSVGYMIMGNLGSAVVSANSIATMAGQICGNFSYSISAPASVLIGKAVSSEKPKEIRRKAFTFEFIALGLGAFAVLMILLLGRTIAGFYGDVEQSTRDLAWQIMLILALLQIPQTVEITNFLGSLRGGGDGRFVMIADAIVMWGIALPLAYFAATVWHLPAPIVILFIKIDLPIKCLISVFRLMGSKWIKNHTREQLTE